MKKFQSVYWIVIMFEFFERGAYYGMLSILSVYLTDKLNFSIIQAGSILGIIQPILYFLPIITGAIADKVGYRRMLTIAFSLLGIGYFLTSQTTEYASVFASLSIMAIGAGTFKPVISGTIAKVTDESNSGLGFGIYYWAINLGAFLFPLFIVPFLKSMSWNYVFIASSLCTLLMLIPTIFLYKEPVVQSKEEKNDKIIKIVLDIVKKITTVLLDWKFILFILIYSLFWVLYFQMYGTVLWYVQLFIDATALNNFISGLFNINWHFDVEHVTVINALTIILLQLIISKIVQKKKTMPTIIAGFVVATIGMLILALCSNIWFFIAGLFLFSIGEMVVHPKYISYLGLIAPADKKATYLGFGFLYGVFGSSIGSILGANLYNKFINTPILTQLKLKLGSLGVAVADNTPLTEVVRIGENYGISKQDIISYGEPTKLWLIFCLIGVIAIISLLLYSKFITNKKISEEK